MNDKILLLEDLVRESYATIVWTHKVHEKQADICLSKYRSLETIRVIVSSIASAGVISLLFVDEFWIKLISALLSSVTVIISALFKSFNSQELSATHKKAAVTMLRLRDNYKHLLLCIRIADKSYEELDEIFLSLEKEKHCIYKDLPMTSNNAVILAEKALKINKDNSFSDEEINAYLPESLHKNS
jgi:hypothetical protein